MSSSSPGALPPDAMQAEFDTMAAWTEHVVRDLGPDYAVVAGCRGSGSPAGLAWLCEALQLTEGEVLLDAGAGVGGPAAYAAEHYGCAPVLVEPMLGACTAARGLFGFPTLAAWCQQLPFGDDTFAAAWCLGVLCTTTEKAELLAELHRVLGLQGRLGLLVLVQAVDNLPVVPEGNSFPTEEELAALLQEAGFLVVEQVDASQVPAAPVAWQARVDRVDAVLEERFGRHQAWQDADRQSSVIGGLLRDGSVRTLLLHAVSV